MEDEHEMSEYEYNFIVIGRLWENMEDFSIVRILIILYEECDKDNWDQVINQEIIRRPDPVNH